MKTCMHKGRERNPNQCKNFLDKREKILVRILGYILLINVFICTYLLTTEPFLKNMNTPTYSLYIHPLYIHNIAAFTFF
jgi:hypothetical protein